MALQKEMKIGLSNQDKQNMRDDIHDEVVEQLFDAFSTDKAYIKGDYVSYNGIIYEFTASKPAGAWDSTKVEIANLNDYMNDINGKIDSQDEDITDFKEEINDDFDEFKDGVNTRLDNQDDRITTEMASITQPKYYDVASLPTTDVGLIVGSDGYIYSWNGTEYVKTNIVYQATQVSDVNILELDEDLQDAFNVTFKDTSITEYQKHTGSKFIYNAQYNLLAEQSNQYLDCIVYQVEANKIYKIKADARVQSVIYCFCNSIPTTSTTATPINSDFVANIQSDQYLEYVVKAPANCYLLMSVRNGTTNYGVFEIDNIRAKVDGSIPLSAIDTSQEVLKENLVPLSTSNVNSYIYTTNGTKDSSSSQFKSVDTEVIENAIKIKIKKGVGVYGGAFLDENKVWISSFPSTTVGTEYNIPTNCKYVNITVNMNTNDNRFSFIVQTYKITNLETDYNADYIPSVWKNKKILCLGTSVSFGSGATENYIHYASEKLGFNLINTSVPGEAIHTQSDGSPLTWGSTSLSISEYASYGTTIASEPILPIVPNGSYNNYYRTWEHIFNAENNDVDLYVYDVVPNNGNFDMTDWNDFNKSTWTYTTGTFADHRTTFLGALLYLMDKMYEINPNARMVFVLSSNFAYSNGKQAFETIANYYKIPIIDLWGKINTSPKSIIKINQENGTNQHPTTFAHEIMGKMFIGELMKVA